MRGAVLQKELPATTTHRRPQPSFLEDYFPRRASSGRPLSLASVPFPLLSVAVISGRGYETTPRRRATPARTLPTDHTGQKRRIGPRKTTNVYAVGQKIWPRSPIPFLLLFFFSLVLLSSGWVGYPVTRTHQNNRGPRTHFEGELGPGRPLVALDHFAVDAEAEYLVGDGVVLGDRRRLRHQRRPRVAQLSEIVHVIAERVEHRAEKAVQVVDHLSQDDGDIGDVALVEHLRAQLRPDE